MNTYDYPEGSDNSEAPWNQEYVTVEVAFDTVVSKVIEIEINKKQYDDLDKVIDEHKVELEKELTNLDWIPNEFETTIL